MVSVISFTQRVIQEEKYIFTLYLRQSFTSRERDFLKADSAQLVK
jgi:hypothetical protein